MMLLVLNCALAHQYHSSFSPSPISQKLRAQKLHFPEFLPLQFKIKCPQWEKITRDLEGGIEAETIVFFLQHGRDRHEILWGPQEFFFESPASMLVFFFNRFFNSYNFLTLKISNEPKKNQLDAAFSDFITLALSMILQT